MQAIKDQITAMPSAMETDFDSATGSAASSAKSQKNAMKANAIKEEVSNINSISTLNKHEHVSRSRRKH